MLESVSEHVPHRALRWAFLGCVIGGVLLVVGVGGAVADPAPGSQPDDAPTLSDGNYGEYDVEEDESHYFAIDTTPGTDVTATIEFDHDDGDLDMEATEPDASTVIDRGQSTTDNEFVSFVTTDDGRHYIEVYGFGSANGSYDLTIETEPIENAATVDDGETISTQLREAPSHRYEVELDRGEVVTAFASADDVDHAFGMTIHDSEGTQHDFASTSFEDRLITFEAPTAGTYYIRPAYRTTTPEPEWEINYNLEVILSDQYRELDLTADPDSETITAEPGETIELEFVGSSPIMPDHMIQTTWAEFEPTSSGYAGERVGTGETHTMTVEEEHDGTHITGRITDGESMFSRDWDIEIVRPPEISVEYPDTVRVEESAEFTVGIDDPDREHEIGWRIDGEVHTERSPTVTFESPGEVEGEVVVIADDGAQSEESFVVNVEGVPPEIADVTVPSERIEAGESVTVAATAVDPLDRSESLTYEWRLNDETYSGESVSLTPVTAGTHELELTVTNEHGLTTTITDRLRVDPPTFTLTDDRPRDEQIQVDRGEELTFSTDIDSRVLPDAEAEFYVGSEQIETAPVTSSTVRFDHTFEEPGRQDVHIEVVPENGVSERTDWTIDVSPFRESLRFEDDTSQASVATNGTTTISLSAHNPRANDRAAVIEIRLQSPSGVTVSGGRNVDRGSGASFIATDRLSPGESRPLRLEAAASDAVAGQQLSFEYEIIYYPENEQDATHSSGSNEVKITVEPNDRTDTEGSDELEPDSDSDASDDERTLLRWFGIFFGFMLAVGYLSRR